jgi:hypothetical protein
MILEANPVIIPGVIYGDPIREGNHVPGNLGQTMGGDLLFPELG